MKKPKIKLNNKYVFNFQMQGIGVKSTEQGILPTSKEIGK